MAPKHVGPISKCLLAETEKNGATHVISKDYYMICTPWSAPRVESAPMLVAAVA